VHIRSSSLPPQALFLFTIKSLNLLNQLHSSNQNQNQSIFTQNVWNIQANWWVFHLSHPFSTSIFRHQIHSSRSPLHIILLSSPNDQHANIFSQSTTDSRRTELQTSVSELAVCFHISSISESAILILSSLRVRTRKGRPTWGWQEGRTDQRFWFIWLFLRQLWRQRLQANWEWWIEEGRYPRPACQG